MSFDVVAGLALWWAFAFVLTLALCRMAATYDEPDA